MPRNDGKRMNEMEESPLPQSGEKALKLLAEKISANERWNGTDMDVDVDVGFVFIGISRNHVFRLALAHFFLAYSGMQW